MATSRRAEALTLAEELLTDIELRRITPLDAARKAGRLARMLDDTDAIAWLRYETGGYPKDNFDGAAVTAAARSNRAATVDEVGRTTYWTAHLATLSAEVESARTELSTGGGTSHSEYAAVVEMRRENRSSQLRTLIAERSELIERVLGSFHDYVSDKYQELRFGAAVETAFEVVRQEVDGAIGILVPDALPKLSAAFENTTSTNPEDWASAAATCRRLLKEAADALRPPGPDKDGRSMNDDHYINRLVDWIASHESSTTAADMITSDLEYLGRRLDAALDAGHQGAHAEVSRFNASRFVTGTYLLLGDILRLQG